MKKFLLVAVIIFICVNGYSQDSDTTLEKKFLLNFVVPDMPAFKGLGVEKSDLLRPSDLKDFAFMLNPFYSNGKTVIPKNFGLEFAPWKMASRNWTLKDYNEQSAKRFMYNSSFSIATSKDSSVYASKVAIGYRFTILSNKADVIRIVYDESAALKQKADDALALKNNLEDFWVLNVLKLRPPQSINYSTEHQDDFYKWLADSVDIKNKNLNKELKALALEAIRIFGDGFSFKDFKKMKFIDLQSKMIEKLITEYKNKNWNASRFDAAISFIAESKDSLLSNSRFSSLNLWATQAIKAGKKGQLLLGAALKMPNNAVDKTQKTPLSFSLSSRFLAGNSGFRFFGETQWKTMNYGTINNSVFLNLGAEIRVAEKFWILASSGVDNLRDKKAGNWFNQLAANIDLRYGF
ncbi:MAG: hypothetical protein QM725_12365 [Lacibacter sp.]